MVSASARRTLCCAPTPGLILGNGFWSALIMADESRASDAATSPKVTDAGPTQKDTPHHDDASASPARDGRLVRQIAKQLKSRIGPERYRAWFESGTTHLRVSGATLQVDSQNQFVADWIDRHFAGDLRMVARDALGDGASVDVTVAPARSPARPGDAPAAPPKSRQRHGDDKHDGKQKNSAQRHEPSTPESAPPPTPRSTPRITLRKLSDFVVGESNRLASTAAQRLAESERQDDASALLIYGECGVGKTHLLQGICERLSERSKRREAVRYITAEQFTNEYITAVRQNTLNGFRREYRRLELLAIDDVHFLAAKTATQNEFLHTMDAIDLSGARLVLASDEHPRNINQFSPSLVSRLVSRLVVRIDPPDRVTRLAIVKKLAAQRGLPLLDAAAESIASRCTGSVREIQGVLAQLAAMRDMTPGHVSGEIGTIFTDRLFNEYSAIPRSGPVRIATIIDAVCENNGIERSDLFGRSRHARVVLGRGLITYLARELTNHSYPEIAQALGRPCHSTVHAAARRIEDLVKAASEDMSSSVERKKSNGSDSPVDVRAMLEDLRARILRTSNRRGASE
jgi:chromosomal replication initiator protein